MEAPRPPRPGVRLTFLKLIRGSLAFVGGLFVLAGGMELANSGAFRLLQHRLKPLYAITREVRKGMPRDQVMRVIQEHDAPYLEKSLFPDGNITLWVQYTLTDTCSTAIAFRDGALDGTWTIGEDSSTDYCPHAPPDIR